MNCSKNVKRLFAAVVCLVLALTMLCPLGLVYASTGKGLDVVLVVDDTSSMQTTDPDKLSAMAIKKFVDVLPDSSDIKLGIATYDLEIMPGSLDLGQTKDAVKAFADNNILQSGAGTNAAAGVEWAVDQLEAKSDDSRNKAIILVGDGQNDFRGQSVHTDESSNKVLEDAIATAAAKDIKVYTLAMNPESDEFRQYFKNIADTTQGKNFEPKAPQDLDGIMNEILVDITGGIAPAPTPIPLTAKQPKTVSFDVPDGVFEMNLRCDHGSPVSITFTDPDGNIYNEDSNDVTYSKQKGYSNYKIQEPKSGTWTVTFLSDVDQTITPQFVFHTDLTVNLSKNQTDVVQKSPVQFIATVNSQGAAITDNERLESFDAELVIAKLDDEGNVAKTKTEKMKVEGGQLVLEYEIQDAGKHEVYAELIGDKSSIKSNVLSIDVIPGKFMPLWLKLLIVLAVLILLALVVWLYINSRVKDGTDYVRGNVSIKIIGRLANDETKIFDPTRLNCEMYLTKKNTMTDLIDAYKKWYRSINSGELAEITLNQYLGGSLTDVTDRISVCGNKKKQTIVRIPAPKGYEMQLDGMDVTKPVKMAFSGSEKEMDLRIKNQNCVYTLTLIFYRD